MNIVLTRESNGKTDRVEITVPNCGDLSWTFSTDGVITKEDRYEGPDAHGAARRWADHLCQTQGYTEQQEPETPATCPTHPSVTDERGVFAARLPVTPCESGADYLVWDDNDGGALCAFDCAMEAANYAAEILAEDDDCEMRILRQCHDHEGQPDDGCPECGDEYDEDEDEQDDDSEDWG